jgi:Tol biopolymer transport system component
MILGVVPRRIVGWLVVLLALLSSSCPAQLRPAYQLAFASDRSGDGDIFLLDQWGRVTNVTNTRYGEWSPRWSPDGLWLAFTSQRSGQADIWLMNLETQEQRNLTQHPAWDYSPAWSPDGQAIAFISERDGDAELFMQGLSSSTAQQLTFNTHPDETPTWSPDGSKVAFTSISNDTKQILLLDISRQLLTRLPYPNHLSGSHPAWSPDGREIAFVGWEDTAETHLYSLDLTTHRLNQLYATSSWLGSLSWSSDGRWLFFTARPQGQHDLLALNRRTGIVTRLTKQAAWDDFAALRPGETFTPQAEMGTDEVAQPTKPPAEFGYGVNLADLSNTPLVSELGFNIIKGYVNWATVEAKPHRYRWADPDTVLRAAHQAPAQVVLRIHGVPAWARPEHTSLSHPPTDLADLARFMRAIAARYRGQVAAYEIWNEPNLNYEWGYRQPDPAEYTAMLQVAYQAIKASDPTALVISGGLAPTGAGNLPDAWGGEDFVRGMYQAGAKGYFDALGLHLYTYGRSPDETAPGTINFDQVADLRQVMLAYDDAETPIWITELGWVLETHWALGDFLGQGVDPNMQAAYLSRAYQKIETEWPFVEAAFLFNLDFSLAPWYPAAEQMRWFAILNPDRTPRPAFTALRNYTKRGTIDGKQ